MIGLGTLTFSVLMHENEAGLEAVLLVQAGDPDALTASIIFGIWGPAREDTSSSGSSIIEDRIFASRGARRSQMCSAARVSQR